MTVCRSKAWDERVLRSAWWVHASQVSKTAPSGQYLSTGSFIIRGKKNPLTPHRLEMGLGILFRVVVEKKKKEEEEDVDLDNGGDFAEGKKDHEESIKNDVDASLEDVLETFVLTTTASTLTPTHKEAERKEEEEEKTEVEKEEEEVQMKEKKLPRGKRSKVKRAKRKYKDQDEEEYRIAMAALKSSGKRSIEYKKRFDNNSTSNKKRKDTEDKTLKNNRTQDVIVKQHHRPRAVKHQEEEKEEEEKFVEDSHAEVSELVSAPSKEQLESSLMCIPVVAPFGALKDYTYKIKITPGKMKRGKCAKAAIASFITKKDEHASRLMSDIPIQDVMNAMLANSQVQTTSSSSSSSSKSKKSSGKKGGKKGSRKKKK